MADTKVEVRLPEVLSAKYELRVSDKKRSIVNGREIVWENATQEDIDWAIKYKCPTLVVKREVKAATASPKGEK
jgi:hypothetical protein